MNNHKNIDNLSNLCKNKAKEEEDDQFDQIGGGNYGEKAYGKYLYVWHGGVSAADAI